MSQALARFIDEQIAAARIAETLPDPDADSFRARCETVANRFASGELSQHEAVDGLQNFAVAYGLVAELGQDAVQAIIGAAFAAVRGDDCDATESEAPRVARSTLDAAEWLFFHVKDRARFDAWMMRHSEAERDLITAHLKRRKRDRAGTTSW